jgi:hypothetical protein
MKPVLNDLLLILHQDAESLRTLRGVAEKLGCDWIEADSQESLEEVLAIRHPTIAVVTVDNVETNGLAVLKTLTASSAPPATFLVGSIDAAVDKDLMLDVFTRLRILGVGISLDNFGTGLSSLTELYRMPYSEIKVDHALMADVTREPDAMLIERAIADLAHTLKLAVCAEGIENRQMLEFARSSGFDSAQGRFFSGPVPASEIEHVVHTWPSFGPAATGTWRAISTRDVDGSATTYPVRRPERIEREAS